MSKVLPRGISPRSRRLVRSLESLQERARPTMERLVPTSRRRDVEVVDLGGASVRVHRPRLAVPGPGPALLWVHGGGYVIGTAAQEDAFCRRFADELGAVVAAVDYRLAPEHPFPTPLEDCHDALVWLAERDEVDARRVAIGGASAGGGLAAGLALMARDRGVVQPALQLLTYPMLDDRTAFARRPGRARLPALEQRLERLRMALLPGCPAGFRRRQRPRVARPLRGPHRAAPGVGRRRHAGPVPGRGPGVRRTTPLRGRAVPGGGGRGRLPRVRLPGTRLVHLAPVP